MQAPRKYGEDVFIRKLKNVSCECYRLNGYNVYKTVIILNTRVSCVWWCVSSINFDGQCVDTHVLLLIIYLCKPRDTPIL